MNAIFNAIYLSKNHLEAIKKLDHLNPVKEEFEKLVSQFDEKKEELDKVIFYEFEAKYYINSPVCTVISIQKVPNKSLLCVHIKDGKASISARCQNNSMHMGDMMRECTQGLKDSHGGGHSVAAGAKVNQEDYETFKKRVLIWVKEHE
jgi:single-stranded DNA-specific DHH superfamily exonuclease